MVVKGINSPPIKFDFKSNGHSGISSGGREGDGDWLSHDY